MKRTLISLALFAAFAANATGNHTPTGTATAGAVAGAVSGSSASQKQAQKQTTSVKQVVKAAPITVTVTAPAAPQELSKTAVQETIKEPASEKPSFVQSAPTYERPVSSAFAPSISPTSPCALTVSGGLQLKEVGMSFGGTPIATFCKTLEIARAAYNQNDKTTAEEVMCGETEYRAARKRAKRPCAEDLESNQQRAEAILADRPVAASSVTPLLP